MIFVDRQKFSIKAGWQLKNLRARARVAKEVLIASQRARGQIKLEETIWIRFKPLLTELFHGKCAYCETRVDISSGGDIDMFRPKKLYPLLAYEWTNLLLSCAICNRRYKKDQFPMEGDEPGSSFDLVMLVDTDYSNSKPLLLDPCNDQPQEHLAFSEDEKTLSVPVTGLTDRGRTTIAVLGLNRPELLQARYVTWGRARALLRLLVNGEALQPRSLYEILSGIQKFQTDEAEYAGAVRQLSRAWLERHKGKLKKAPWWPTLYHQAKEDTIYVSREMYKSAVQEEEIALEQRRGYSVVGSSPAEMEMFNFAAKRIDRIEISNLRGIPRLDFTFPAMGECESWIMLIGENGVGKTTILQGVALALMGEERANKYGLNAAEFTRRGEREGFVRVHINAIGSVELRFNRTSKRFTVDPADPKVPLLAYGPTRLLPSDTEKKPLTDRNIRTDNLFKPTVPLSDAEIWLAATSKDEPETFHNVGQALCRLLMISEKSPPRARDGKVEIRMADGWRRISELSSGYRSVLALVVDIAIGTSGKRRKAEEAVGIVLLDEIEIHLHPIWKISIVERLRNVFPQLSFLVTTHDPLCLKGLQDREIVALRRDESGLITFAADMPSVNSLNADDILTSNELFELPSSRNSASPVTIARYSALLNVSALSEEQKRELKRLQEIISQMFSGALIPMQREVERAVTIVLKHIREGKEGRELTKDAVAEIRRQVLDLGRQS